MIKAREMRQTRAQLEKSFEWLVSMSYSVSGFRSIGKSVSKR